jgi:sugar lactone lactonase YvrE
MLASLLFGGEAARGAANYEPYTFTHFAGSFGGYGYSDGTGSAARFDYPQGVAVDSSGNIYVADLGNSTIRKITSGGVVTTLAGLEGSTGGADGTGSAARFDYPQGVAVDSSGNIYVADTDNDTIRKITPGGVVTTLEGLAGSVGSADGAGSAARFYKPYGVAVDSSGNVYVADRDNFTIRKITPDGVVTTLLGSSGSALQFWTPQSVAVDSSGNVYVADTFNNTIDKITAGGVVTTLAGQAGIAGSADGTGSAALFNGPAGVAVDSSGNVYVTDSGNATIRTITPAGVVTTLAGLARSYGSDDGTGSAARFLSPAGVAVDALGNIYVADVDNSTIRKISPGGVVTTLAGLAGSLGSDDGTGSAVRFWYPEAVAVDPLGNLYVDDRLNNTIRKGWVNLRLIIAPDGSGGIYVQVQGAGNLSYGLQRAQAPNGPWITSAPQIAPGSGLVEFHDLFPPPDQAFYRAVQR